ncbi:MAG TPA: homocysteine S-methyltransferase family protein [Anaeromyxobacteraceae bacterium]|nr:homocysteine S-methyltransferase family protein [Anaeromyxobacteraceae bacterium]
MSDRRPDPLAAPALLDAAMGTALLARGLPPGELPEAWILTRPEEVAAVHAAHTAAGARLLLTCTFNAAEPRLATRGLDPKLEALCGWAERLARVAARSALVAGCLGPSGLPGSAHPAEWREAFARPFRALAAAGADLLWAETHYRLGEARAALAAGLATGLPVAVTMAFAEREGALVAPDGAPAAECLRALAQDGAAAVGVNCVAPSPALAALVAEVASGLPVPLAVKPNAGPPGRLLPPEDFARAVAPALRAGARLAGGCCGTTADHLRALGRILDGPFAGSRAAR